MEIFKITRNKALLSCGALFFFSLLLQAQIPEHYYDDAFGKKQDVLKTALKNIIANHDEQTYKSLWTHFRSTDNKGNDIVWDMYSDGNSQYDFSYNNAGDQCGGSISKEGDCFNREHSMPKSWFNGEYPMYTDLFHLYPTDGFVNNKRGNEVFSEVGSATWTSFNGSKLGKSSFTGYSGVAFEPIDQFKGDFARTYFYMVTCYEDKVSSWNSDMLANNKYPAFTAWAVNLLLKWSRNDPVSQKEIDRNNAVYNIQKNRNPYIDYPQLAEYVWGDSITYSFNPDKPTSIESVEPELKPVVYTLYGAIYIENIPAETTIRIFNTMAGLIRQTHTSNGNFICDFPKNELYIVQISDNQGNIQTIKIMNR